MLPVAMDLAAYEDPSHRHSAFRTEDEEGRIRGVCEAGRWEILATCHPDDGLARFSLFSRGLDARDAPPDSTGSRSPPSSVGVGSEMTTTGWVARGERAMTMQSSS